MLNRYQFPSISCCKADFVKFFVLTMFMLFLQGCFEDKPSASHFKDHMNSDLPESFVVTDVDIEVQENTGDSVEPNWKTRYIVTYETTEPFYVVTGSNSVATFVREVQPKGFEFSAPVTAVTVLDRQGGWSSTLSIGSSEGFDKLGKPASAFRGMVVREGNEADKYAYDLKLKSMQ